MSIAHQLSRRLRDVLGDEAADTMVDWMGCVEGSRTELRELNDLSIARFDSLLSLRIAELRADVNKDLGLLRSDVTKGIADLRGELKDDVAGLHASFARMETTIERQKVELTRWALGFWLASLVTLTGTLAALSRLPR